MPRQYWEARAAELIEAYDQPETWAERMWLKAGIEEELVPRWLRGAGVRTVLVVGAGSGRQYEFLQQFGFDIHGFDISPTLVAKCRERFPAIPTELHGVSGAGARFDPADAVLSTAVLQHIAPAEIEVAVAELKSLAQRLVVLREATFRADESFYLWGHDYPRLFGDWAVVQRVVTDEDERSRTELFVFATPHGTSS